MFPNRIRIGSASPLSQCYYKNQQDWQQRHAEGIGLKKSMRRTKCAKAASLSIAAPVSTAEHPAYAVTAWHSLESQIVMKYASYFSLSF